MTELHGVTGAPYATPQVRKKLPTPYNRDRIDLDGGRRARRSWKDVSVVSIKKGDTVAQFGTVASTRQQVHVANGTYTWQVRLYNVMGDFRDYLGEQRVYAFALDPDDE